MKRHFPAALAGVIAGLLIAAVPLWRQGARLENVASPPVSRNVPSKSQSLAPRPPAAAKAHDLVQAEAEAASLTAEECRPAAEDAFKSQDTPLLRAILTRWAALDGAAVYAWMEPLERAAAFPGGFSGLGLFEDVYYTWASADPHGFAAGMEKAATALSPGERAENAFRCVKYLMQVDLLTAIRTGSNMGMDSPVGMPISRNDLRPALRTVADAEAVGAEILAHPEWLAGKSRETPLYLLVALRECWQEMDPAGWERWAAAHPEAAEKSANEPVRPGLKFLRSPDRAAAASELLAAVPPEELARTTADLLRVWDDMEAAGQWLNTLPEGPVRTTAATAYALESAKDNPQAAFQWADAIADPAARARTQRRVFTTWHDADPAAAAAWLPQSGWSDTQQQAARDIMAAAPPRK